jgi:hypothetical protein
LKNGGDAKRKAMLDRLVDIVAAADIETTTGAPERR